MTKAQKALADFNSGRAVDQVKDPETIREILTMHDKLVDAVVRLDDPSGDLNDEVFRTIAYCQKEKEQP